MQGSASEATRGEPLSGQDRAFLIWASRRRPMRFGAVCTFRLAPEAPMPGLKALRATLAGALPGAPRLRQRLARRGWTRRPVWTTAEDFRIEEHVRAAPAGADLRAVAEDVLCRRLPRARPLWAVWLVPAAPDERCFSLVIQVHHAVTDGIGAVRLLETLLGARAAEARPAPLTTRRGTKGYNEAVDKAARAARPRRPRARLRGRPLMRLLRGFLGGGPAKPLNRSVSPERRHRWLTSDAEALDATAERTRTTRRGCGATGPAPARAPRTSLPALADTASRRRLPG